MNQPEPMPPVKEITVAALKTCLRQGDDPVIVDVREDDEVAGGMIPGALHIRLGDLADRYQELPDSQDIYFICRGGGRSARACRFMYERGRTNAVSVAGGMELWLAHAP